MVPANILDIDICDSDGNGQETVNITVNETDIFGAQNPVGFNLTYHEMLASATAAVGSPLDTPIASPTSHTLIANPLTPTTIFVRLENIATGCTNVGQFNVVTAPLPVFTPPASTLEVCDTEGPTVGTSNDGISSFDLSALTPGIIAGTNNLRVTYFESQANLDAGIPITTVDEFVNTFNPQTIFIQIEDTVNDICDAEITIDLVVNELPALPLPLDPIITCDDDDDGFGEFDLQTYANTLSASLIDIELRFYETFDNAQIDSGFGQLDVTQPYNNIAGLAELFVVVQACLLYTSPSPRDS